MAMWANKIFARMLLTAVVLLSVILLSVRALAYDPSKVEVTGHTTPDELKDIGITEHLGEALDLTLPFVADDGTAVQLGRYFSSGKPVLMAMVYYNCPSLCNYHLNAVVDTLKQLKWRVGQQFDVVAVSMDHREGPALASAKKLNYVKVYGHLETLSGWHFLTGDEASVQRLANQLGFKFRWDEKQQQYAHAAAAYVITPSGYISRYIYGLNIEPQTLRFALLEATNGKIGSVVEQVIMWCFRFDPHKNRYSLYAWNVMRAGAVLIVLILAIFLVPQWLRERNHRGIPT